VESKDEVRLQNTSILSDGYGLIPKKISRDKDLTMEAKAIYGYLASFAGSGGYCYPSKELMISELGTTEKRFNKNIKILKEHGYIKVHKRRKGNRNDSNLYELLMDIRDIEIAKKEFDTGRFDSGQFDRVQNDSGQFDSVQNDPPNINSFNNNSSNISKYIDKENSPNKLKEFRILYEQNIGLINGITAEYLIELSETIDVNLFKRAIEIATDKGKCNLGYIKGIIKQWLDVNIKTLEQLEAYKLQQQSKKGVKTNGSSTKRTKQFEQQIPDDDEKDEEYYRLLRECERLSRE
jgi:DnaD/phage-associated family protein